MVSKIEQDHQRFRQIVQGKIRRDLRKFLSRGELIGREGKRFVSIPVHDIDIPTFRYGDNSGGVGMGEGQEGQSVGGSNGQGGEQEGRHILEVDVTMEELADILSEELKLPRIKPRGEHRITSVRDKYSGIRPVGPAGRCVTLRGPIASAQAPDLDGHLRRGQPRGDHPDPQRPAFPEPERGQEAPEQVLIVYMMDVSGSMGDEQKELVRLEAFSDRRVARRELRGRGDAIHRSRRAGPGSRPQDVLQRA
ncbi:MAG: DUF444 family protein [Phycisphaerales bacterium]